METGMFKRLASIAILAVGFCLIGCNKPTPEQVAERTSLLFRAIENDDMEQAKACIKAGANVNANQGGNGPTPLLYAIQKNRTEMVELLAKSKADLNKASCITDRNKWTPLNLACVNDNYDAVAILIKYGADVNAKDETGHTPLMRVRSGTVAEMLIKSGADVNAKDNNGVSALYHANYKSKDRFFRPNEGIIAQLLAAGATE